MMDGSPPLNLNIESVNKMKGYFSRDTYSKIIELVPGDYIRHNGAYMSWTPDIRASNVGQCYKITHIHFPNIYVYKCATRKNELIYVRKSTNPKPTHVIHISNLSYYITRMSEEDRLFLEINRVHQI